MIKFFTELAPLLAFFVGYKTDGIMSATLYMLIASVISITIMYILERKLNKVNIISTVILLMSSSLTLFSGNAIFIKMKPTLVYAIFALIFFISSKKSKPVMSYILGKSIQLKTQKNWIDLGYRFMCFFICMAIFNEIIWRNFAEDIWVNFKVFAALPLTLIFVLLQIPFIIRYSVQKK